MRTRTFMMALFMAGLFFNACSKDDDDYEFGITVRGHISGYYTTFDGEFARLADEPQWESYEVAEDSTVLDIQNVGTYLVKAHKPGYSSFPVIDTISVSETNSRRRTVFAFYADTSGGSDSLYTIEVNGYYEGLPVSFDCYYSVDSDWDTTFIGDAGRGLLTFSNPCTIMVGAFKEGFMVYPQIDTVVLTDLYPDKTANFEFHTDDSTDAYKIHLIGQSNLRRVSFSASYTNDSSWTDIEIGTAGSADISVEDPGYYYIMAFKEGYISNPEMDTVYVGDSVYHAYSVFDFIDTIQPPTLNIIGDLYGSATSFEAEYKLADDTWNSVSVDESGVVSIELSEFGTYFVRAIKDGFLTEPEIDTVIITEIARIASSEFSFIDTSSGGPYYLYFIGQEDGLGIAYNARYRMFDSDEWLNISIGSSGIRSIELPRGGRWFATAERDGYFALPIVDTIDFNADNAIDTAHFTFIDTLDSEPEYTIHFIGETGGLRTDFTAYFAYDGLPWDYQRFESGSGEASFYLPGDYIVYARKPGYRCIPEMDTINLSDEASYGYINFDFIDTLEVPTYILLLTGTHIHEPIAFTAYYRRALPSEPWSSVLVSDLGETAIHLEVPGDYEIRPTIDAPFQCTVEEVTISFEASETEKRVNFSFVDTTAHYEPTNILIADWDNDRIVQMDDFSGTGWQVLEDFSRPLGITIDRLHRIYIADQGNNRIVRVDDIHGSNPVYYGTGGSGEHELSNPLFVKLDEIGRIYISDLGNSRIVRIDDMTGAGWCALTGDGAGDHLSGQYGLALDSHGRIYIADGSNHRVVRVDDMSGAGWITYGTYGSGEGQFITPRSICISPDGDILVTDFRGHRLVQFSNMEGSGWSVYPLDFPTGLNVDDYKRIYIGREFGITRIDDISGRNLIDYGSYGFGVMEFRRAWSIEFGY